MHTFTITVTDVQYKALAYTAFDPEEYITNFVNHSAEVVIDEIYKLEVERMINDPDVDSIPANKEQVVLDADIMSAADRQAQIDAELTA